MCGIVGYVGQCLVQDVLFVGLEKFEYCGYDFVGILIQSDGRFELVCVVGNLGCLKVVIGVMGDGVVVVFVLFVMIGIGYTCWAMYGRVIEENVYLHYDDGDCVYVVVNGIVENYFEFK